MHEVEMEWDYLTPVNEAKNVLEGKGFKTSTKLLFKLGRLANEKHPEDDFQYYTSSCGTLVLARCG